MSRKNKRRREGRVVACPTGMRWTAQLELDDRRADGTSPLRIDVPGTFASEAAAVQAAQGVLNEWRVGCVSMRDLVLRELAAVYRHLRQRHPAMEPVAVPTTSAMWNRAIGLWELAGWLDAAQAERYREHVRSAFDASAATIKRHRLEDIEPDPA